jgi:hypothetical protein
VPDERCHLAVRTTHGDTFVDAAGEVGNAVLEKVVCNLYDICKKQMKIYEIQYGLEPYQIRAG